MPGTFVPQEDLFNALVKDDDAAFSVGTSYVMPIAAMADETSPDSVNEGDAGVVAMTLNRALKIVPKLHDGTTEGVDSMRGNTWANVLTYTFTTATRTSTDQTNYNARGAIMVMEVATLIPTGTMGITLTVDMKDAMNDVWVNLFTDGTVTATGSRNFIVYPGVGAATDGITAVRGYPLPRTWRAVVTPTTAGTFRIGVGASYIL